MKNEERIEENKDDYKKFKLVERRLRGCMGRLEDTKTKNYLL